MHNKYWKELNRLLQDLTISETALFKLYQDHVLLEHEVDMDMRYSGNNPECNELAMQLSAKIYKKNSSIAQVLFAALSEVNAAIASLKDFCRNPLCCGKRKFTKYTYAYCWPRLNNGINNSRPNYDMSKSFGGARDGFKTDQRGKRFVGKPFTTSNNITNFGQNPARACGKFNSMNSHKFNGQVRDEKVLENFLIMAVTVFMDHLDLPHNIIIFPRTNSSRTSQIWVDWKEIPEVNLIVWL